jgi:hypothetical protein
VHTRAREALTSAGEATRTMAQPAAAQNGHHHRGLQLPDYRASGVAAKHVRRGLCLLVRHLPVALLLPIAASIG